MPRDRFEVEAKQREAQQVVNELWAERLTPFALYVGKVTKDVSGYTLHFYDARIRTARVRSSEDGSFREAVRAAVLARVDEMSGPLKKPHHKE